MEGTGLAEVVVTARKRAETLQKTAAAVQVIGADALVDRGVNQIIRLQTQVTGLILLPSNAAVYMISRGLGQADSQYQTSPAVEMQEDGLTLPTTGQQFALFDVGDIQFLKGPQGILYGRNAIGGAVIVSSKRPTYGAFSGEGSFEYGNYDLKHGFAAVNLPVNDNAAFRAAIDYTHHDGYLTNGENGLDQIAGRISFQADPTDRLSIFLSVTADDRKNKGFGEVTLPMPVGANGNPWYVPAVPQSGIVNGVNFNDPHNRGWLSEQSYLVNGEFNYKLNDDLKLSYVTGYFSHNEGQVRAYEVEAGSIFVNNTSGYAVSDSWDFQNELRATFERDGVTAIVGALQHRFEAQNNVVQVAYRAGTLINGPHSPTESDYAVFGDLIVPIADGLRGELGARQSWDIKHDKGILSGQAADLNSSNFPRLHEFLLEGRPGI